MQKFIFQNIANFITILGVIPIFLLFLPNGFKYIIPIIIYQNITDDLDGIIARKLKITSEFGCNLDKISDAVLHSTIALTVGVKFGICTTIFSIISVISIIVRTSSKTVLGQNITGSYTNELMMYILFVLIFSKIFNFNPGLILILVFVINSITMVVNYKIKFLIYNFLDKNIYKLLFNIFLISIYILTDFILTN